MTRTGKWVLLLAALAVAFAAGVWRGGTSGKAGAGSKVLYWVDPMHPAFRSDKPGVAPDCGMQLEPVYADGAGTPSASQSQASLPFGSVEVSPERQQLIGVRLAAVERAPATRTVRLLGRVVPDEARVYRVNAANDWYAKTVSPATTGSKVRKGDLLATFYPPGDLVPVIQGYLARLDSSIRVPTGATPPMEQLRLGVWKIETFRNSLRTQGLMEHQIDEIAKLRMIPEVIEVLSPVSGIVLARDIAAEQRSDKGAELYRIADLSRVWVLGDLFGADAQAAKAGLPVKVTLPDQGRTFQGRVSQVKPVFDGATRTLKLRVEVDNPGDVLRPDMFVDVEIAVEARPALAVPLDAVLDSGLRKTVFVDRGKGTFEPRRVETGAYLGDRVEIVRGLMAGERVVVSGNFLLDSESRMRAAALGIQGTPGRCVVCDMDIDLERTRAAGLTAEYRGRRYAFCSEECRREFAVAPERHAGKGVSDAGERGGEMARPMGGPKG